MVHRLFDRCCAAAPLLGAGLDWKTSLQELTAATGPRRARVPDRRGRARTTQAVHRHGGGRRPRAAARASGRTKKEAEQKAAELAWRTLTAEAAAVEHRRPTAG